MGFRGAVLRCILVVVCGGCSSTYPYLFLTEDCSCEVYTYRDERRKFAIEFRAEYRVDERIRTRVELDFRNSSREALSLEQAFVIGTSRKIHYQNNGRAMPLPFVRILPGESYLVILEGEDTELIVNPWLKIAGERTVIELRGLILGTSVIPPIQVVLVPTNPKLSER